MIVMVNELKDPEVQKAYIEKLLKDNNKEKQPQKPIKLYKV